MKRLNTCSNCRVDVIAFFQRLIGGHGVAEDEDEHGGDDVSPGDLPISVEFDAQHEFNVANESIESVDPADADSFDGGHEEDDETAAEIIDDIQDEQTARSDVN